MKIIGIFIFIIFGLLFAPFFSQAHQPNFSNNQKKLLISDPEVSQAFYGYLNGEPVTYTIDSTSTLNLYVGLLTPDLPSMKNNLSAIIKNSAGETIANLDGLNDFSWKHYYEDYGGDWYFKGPEFKQEVLAGTYTISITRPGNEGEYVLVVGELESFPLSKMSRMTGELYKIKTQFFHKPWYSIFQNKLGEYLGLGLLALIVIFFGIVYLIKLIIKKKLIAFS